MPASYEQRPSAATRRNVLIANQAHFVLSNIKLGERTDFNPDQLEKLLAPNFSFYHRTLTRLIYAEGGFPINPPYGPETEQESYRQALADIGCVVSRQLGTRESLAEVITLSQEVAAQEQLAAAA